MLLCGKLQLIMKTIIKKINEETGTITECAVFINENSAKENLINYCLIDKGINLFEIKQREKISDNIKVINNRTAIIELNNITYTSIRVDDNGKIISASDDKTIEADNKSAEYYYSSFCSKNNNK